VKILGWAWGSGWLTIAAVGGSITLPRVYKRVNVEVVILTMLETTGIIGSLPCALLLLSSSSKFGGSFRGCAELER
jgi:F0F1-type ATP synthase membrane subunit c/vacuolar-type H+-ATPase subunit K